METVVVLLRSKYMRVVPSIRQPFCTHGLCGSLRCRRVIIEVLTIDNKEWREMAGKI